jgi:hypothetical protein
MIGLNLPNRIPADKTAFDIRPRNLETWLNDMPRANVGETAKQIYTLIRQTNQLDYPYKKRIVFLETLREPVATVTELMKKHFVGINLPLADKNQKIAAITKKLFSYMATGYKIALQDALVSKPLFFEKQPLALLTHRCISYMGKNILTSYQSYSQLSSQHWGELHKLYRFAEKQNILRDKVKDEQLSDVIETSIMDEYSKILLLSLASPAHLRHGESGKVYEALENWLPLPLIRPLSKEDQSSDSFADNLAQSCAPSSLSFSLADGVINKRALRMIDTTELCKTLQSELEKNNDIKSAKKSGSGLKNPKLSLDLLQRLLTTWDISTKRHFPRVAKNEEVKITIGLSAAHQLISQKNQVTDIRKYSQKYNCNSNFSATDITHDLNVPSKDVWAIIYTPQTTGTTKDDADHENITIESKKYQSDHWDLVNESTKGLMINNRDELKNKVQVGELVSVYRNTDGHAKKWNIGVIQWLRFNADESLQMGIEILNPNSAAVGIRTSESLLQRALMLPEISQLKQPASLVTSPKAWKKGDKIIINMQGKEVSATLTNPLQNTGLFSQFQFEITHENSLQEEPASTAKVSDMSNIWSLM